MPTITTCLWFQTEASEPAALYTRLFPDSRILSKSPARDETGTSIVSFELWGRPFLAFGGGTDVTLNYATSLQVPCETQEEVDRYWDALSAGGTEQQCGWLTDKFGLSWQIVPTILPGLLSHPDQVKADRVFQAMLGMVKLDIAELQAAASAS
ncbi:MAG: VOC family protein [Segniliparus sp.]|uniref:VOC family protein n=1 Tax=Segniliparus sp. TaxID=2804064 RepID=UPI003F2F3331